MGNSAEIIGNIATSIFLILIVATVFTQYYVIKVDLGPLGTYPQYPYKEYFFSLAISSAISLAIGIAAAYAAKNIKQSEPRILGAKFKPANGMLVKCRNCGNELQSTNFSFCPYCETPFTSKTLD